MMITNTTEDRYVAGEKDAVIGGLKTWVGEQPKGIIWCHGSGETANTVVQSWRTYLRQLGLHATVHVGDLGFQTWGSDLAMTRIGQARDLLINDFGVTGEIALVGMSMGGCNALNYALRHPDQIACVAGLIPLTDLAEARANPYLTSRYAEIDAIYGVPPAADYTGHNPIDFADDIDPDMPIRLWSSSNDPLVPPSMTEAFIAARPQTRFTDIGAAGHNIVPALTPALVGFIAEHLLIPA